MAIQKYRLQKVEADHSTNIVYLETGSDCVTRPDNSATVESTLQVLEDGFGTLATAVNGKAPLSHSHSEYAVAGHTHSQYLTAHQNLSGYVPTSRKVAGKALTGDITLTASDVGASESGHTHTNYVSTSRTVAGLALSSNISADSLKEALGVTGSGSSTITAPTYPSSIPAVGNTLSWAGKTWRVVHKLTGVAILALEYLETNIAWTGVPGPYHSQEYIGSKIYDECMTFSNTLKLFATDYIIPFGGLPCFIPSYDQVNGDFTYWATQANRIYKNSSGTAKTFWTSTVFTGLSNYGNAWYVNTDGTFSRDNANITYGFRPCVALRL